MLSIDPRFKSLALSLPASSTTAGAAVKMPLAQAHPFEPMAVTHEETFDMEVSMGG